MYNGGGNEDSAHVGTRPSITSDNLNLHRVPGVGQDMYTEGGVLHHHEIYSDAVKLCLDTLDTGWKQNKLVEVCSGVLS